MRIGGVRSTVAVAVLALTASLALAGCGDSEGDTTSKPNETTSASPSDSPKETDANEAPASVEPTDESKPVVRKPIAEASAAGFEIVEEDGAPVVKMDTPMPAVSELTAYSVVDGSGKEIQAGDLVTFNYVLYSMTDGSIGDSSWMRGSPIEFMLGVGNLIEGWDEGLIGAKEGSRTLLVVPQDKAYGPARGDLAFVVDVISIKPGS